ncbi:MAG: aminopeptidase P family protein [Patescibacteria group bacterium]
MADFSSIRTLLKEKKLDAMLFSSSSHLLYLTSYAGFSATERDAFLLVTNNKGHLFTHSLLALELKEKFKQLTVIEHKRDHPFAKNLAEVVSKNKLKKIGFESNNVTVTEYLTITENVPSRLVAVDLRHLRIKKSAEEVTNIRKACQIAQKALKQTAKKLEPDVTEMQIAVLFEANVKALGAGLSFPTIVAFGKNSAVPHHLSDETKLKVNDVALIDCGVRFNNYCSDMTRTFFVGTPTKEQQKVYDTVQQSQNLAVDFIKRSLENNKPISGAAVDDEARDFIHKAGYDSIPHSLGHGIGIEVHEAPALSPTSKETIGDGMAFSLEPGIYLEGKFGVRIEDLFAIQDGKLVKLT